MSAQPESFAGLPEHLQPFAGIREADLPSNLPRDYPHATAVAIRSGVERGDPFAVFEQIETGECERGPDFAPSPAGAVEPVAEDRTRLAAGEHGEHSLTARQNGATMQHLATGYPSDWLETSDSGRWYVPNDGRSIRVDDSRLWTRAELDAEHTRQSRLFRWQSLGSQR